MKSLMKKLLLSLTTLSALFLFTANAYAISFILGDYKFVLDGVSRFENPINETTNPTTTIAESGNLWGVSQIQAIFRDTVSGSGVYDQLHWSKGQDSEYLSLRFGGLDLHYDADSSVNHGYHIVDSFGNPVAANSYPHQSYFVNDNDGMSNLETGGDTGYAYAQMYLSDSDPYLTDVLTVGANLGGDGAQGTFGTTMATGTLVLDMAFAAGALYVDEMTTNNFAAADTNDVYRATANSTSRNESLGYLDILNSSLWFEQFDTNAWFAGSTYLAAVGRTDGFDIRIEASNTSQTPPLTQAMINQGWNARNESSSALVQATIPEPGTIFLVGTGLLCVAGISRRRARS